MTQDPGPRPTVMNPTTRSGPSATPKPKSGKTERERDEAIRLSVEWKEKALANEQKLKEAMAMLKRLEWEPEDDNGDCYCGICYSDKTRGHTKGCALEVLLRGQL